MRLITGLMACVSAGCLSLALANPPPATSASPPAASSAQSTTSAAVAAKAEMDQDEKALRAQGYKPKMVHGEKLFCRYEPKQDSHFQIERCGTADQIKEQTRIAREATEHAQLQMTTMPGH